MSTDAGNILLAESVICHKVEQKIAYIEIFLCWVTLPLIMHSPMGIPVTGGNAIAWISSG